MVLHRSQCQHIFGDWLNGILELSRTLHSIELDLSAFACLSALTLVTGTYGKILAKLVIEIRYLKIVSEVFQVKAKS